MLALGRLLRISLAPSALADIAAGVVLGAGHWPAGRAAFLLMAGSACVYHGGMALNDWADREEDARNARARPIPGREIKAGTALALAASLLVAGPALGWLAAPRAGGCLALIALLAALYDLRARGPWAGPVLLGTCRAGNLSAGLLLGSLANAPSVDDGALLDFPRWIALAPILYGSYVFCISRLARLEDRSPAQVAKGHPALWTLLAAGLLLLHIVPSELAVQSGGAQPGWLVRSSVSLLLGWSALGLLRARPAQPWTRDDVGRVVGMGLRRLLVATCALSAGLGSPDATLVGALILGGYPLSYALRRLFPPT